MEDLGGDHWKEEIVAGTVRYYDPKTKKVVKIPESELAGRTIEAEVKGVEGQAHVEHHLSAELVERIKSVAFTFAEVHPGRLDKWIYDFCLDQTPEREVVVHEMMAEMYTRFVQPYDALGRKKEVYSVVLACSTYPWAFLPADGGKEYVWGGREYASLTREEVEHICHEWLKEHGPPSR